MIKEYIPVKRVFEINENGEQLPLSDKVEIKNNQALLSLKHIESTVPVGSIIYSSSSTPPNGYLVCNGAEISIETYSDLYGMIGETYGEAGEGKFRIPDLIDKVAWGGNGVGIIKDAGLPNITGTLYASPAGNSQGLFYSITGAFRSSGDALPAIPNESSTSSVTRRIGSTFDASRSSTIYGSSTTVQPPALTLLPCIKY